MHWVLKAKAEHSANQVLFCPNGDVQETGASNFILINGDEIITKPLTDEFLHGVYPRFRTNCCQRFGLYRQRTQFHS